MTASPPRLAALEVLTRVREREAYAHETLDAVLRSRRLEPRDAALATRLAYGAVATRGTLDEAIARQADPGTALEPRIADALALGAYEVLFAGTPTHAAVSETVEVVRSLRPKAAGLANALMRRLVKAAPDFPWGDPERDNAALARLYGHPRWLAEMWVEELGRDAARAVMDANNGPAPLFLASLVQDTAGQERLRAQLEAEGADPSPGPLAGTLVAGAPAKARRSEALAGGTALVMDAGAQFAVHAAGVSPGGVVAELGAGRGGKTLLWAARHRAQGAPARRVVAVDLHGFKLESLSDAASRLGFPEVETVAVDATQPRADLTIADGSADVVLVDAPCSGLGTLRRHPDRRWRATRAEVTTLAKLGSHLLMRAARLVKPNGFVVYSTCTIAREENAEVIEGFLGHEAGRAFTIESLAGMLPSEWNEFVTSEGLFQSLPKPGGADGHFVARLRRA